MENQEEERKSTAMEDMDSVAGCLVEADKYGLGVEVVCWALYAMKRDPEMNVMSAINEGLNEWVK